LSDRLTGVSSVNRAAIIGATIGFVAWFAPSLVGGGEPHAVHPCQSLPGRGARNGISRALLVGPWSYAAGAPGGILAPLLVLGAPPERFSQVLNHTMPQVGFSPVAFAVVGMAALFSGQRARASDGDRAYRGNDWSRPSGLGLAWGFASRYVDSYAAQERAHLRDPETPHAGAGG
jgi:Voltage gated chloride channel